MAVPNPTQEMKRVDQFARRGLPPIVLVTGASDFFRQRALEKLLQAVPEDAELHRIDGGGVRAAGDADDDGGDEGSGEAVPDCPQLHDLRGGGLFARSTFVVVRRGANWWAQFAPAVVEIAPRIQQGSGLIVESPKLDKRRKAVAALVKELAAKDAVFEFRDLYDLPYDRGQSPLTGELCRWVVQCSEKLGVALQPESAWLLVGQIGKGPAELFAELERLRDVLGADPARPPLAPRDLVGKTHIGFESTPFEFAEAVLSGDRRAAQRSLGAMFARGVRQKDGRTMDMGGVLPFVSSWMFGQLSRLLEARVLHDRGVSPNELASRSGVYQFQDRFVANVRRNDQAKLCRGITALHACQRASRLTGEDPEVLLERFLSNWFDGTPAPTAEEFGL